MRPQRLIMEGFLAYRRRTEIDFTDADLFVLCGSDRIGKIERDRRHDFCPVRVDPRRQGLGCTAHLGPGRRWSSRIPFSIGDELHRRPSHRATGLRGHDDQRPVCSTGEGQEVLARTADEVTDAVTDLLGLRYELSSRQSFCPRVLSPTFSPTSQGTVRPCSEHCWRWVSTSRSCSSPISGPSSPRPGRRRSTASPSSTSSPRTTRRSVSNPRRAGRGEELPARLEEKTLLEGLLGEEKSSTPLPWRVSPAFGQSMCLKTSKPSTPTGGVRTRVQI